MLELDFFDQFQAHFTKNAPRSLISLTLLLILGISHTMHYFEKFTAYFVKKAQISLF